MCNASTASFLLLSFFPFYPLLASSSSSSPFPRQRMLLLLLLLGHNIAPFKYSTSLSSSLPLVPYPPTHNPKAWEVRKGMGEEEGGVRQHRKENEEE